MRNSEQDASSRRKTRILVADDHETEREYVRTVLGYAGYEVLEAADGEAALEAVRSQRPDLVITDLLMPRVDGLELVRRMRSQADIAATRVIVWSATFRQSEAQTMAAALGVARFVKKPVEPETLLLAVDETLRSPVPPPVSAPILSSLERAHHRLLGDKLFQKTLELEEEIAARRQVEAVLRENQQRFAALVESAMDAIVSVDAEQRIVLFNAAAENMFRCPAAQAIGQPLARFVPGRFRDVHAEHVRRFAADGDTSRGMGRLGTLAGQRADGEEFPIEASISKVQVGGQWRFTAILRDVSERKRLEQAQDALQRDLERRVAERTAELTQANEALLKSNEELQQFVFIASHDLQTPLRAIAGFAQLLQRKYRDRLDAHADELIGQVVDNARRLHHLIHDLLTYARVDSRARRFEPVDFRQVFVDVVGVLDASIRDAGAAVACGELPVVQGDRSQLTQLLQNLVDNAVKYHGDKPPRVEVSAERRAGEWVFSVRDNGIGIAPRHQPHIFEVFRRLHTQRAYPGTGIGLALCRRVVERHGGRIWVESAPGQGSVFHFSLPAGAAARGPAASR